MALNRQTRRTNYSTGNAEVDRALGDVQQNVDEATRSLPSNVFNDGQHIENVLVPAGPGTSFTIPHSLGRALVGYVITGIITAGNNNIVRDGTSWDRARELRLINQDAAVAVLNVLVF